MDLILLLCVIGVTAAAPSDSPNAHYDVIVIGLGSAGTTAATELARAGRQALGLEASDRVGGRVHTVPFGDGIVELGAEWIHGNESSRTYQLATQHDVDLQLQPFALAAYRSDGSEANSTMLTELLDLDLTVDLPNPPENLGSFSTRKLCALTYLRMCVAEYNSALFEVEPVRSTARARRRRALRRAQREELPAGERPRDPPPQLRPAQLATCALILQEINRKMQSVTWQPQP